MARSRARAISTTTRTRVSASFFAVQVLRAAMEGRIGFKEAYDLTGLRGGTFDEELYRDCGDC